MELFPVIPAGEISLTFSSNTSMFFLVSDSPKNLCVNNCSIVVKLVFKDSLDIIISKKDSGEKKGANQKSNLKVV